MDNKKPSDDFIPPAPLPLKASKSPLPKAEQPLPGMQGPRPGLAKPCPIFAPSPQVQYHWLVADEQLPDHGLPAAVQNTLGMGHNGRKL